MRPSIDQIMAAVSQQTTIYKPDLIGRSRLPEHVSARRMMAKTMLQYGYTPLEISSTLQKTRSIVYYYINPKIRSRKAAYHQQVRKPRHGRKIQAGSVLAIQSEQQSTGAYPGYWQGGCGHLPCRAIDC